MISNAPPTERSDSVAAANALWIVSSSYTTISSTFPLSRHRNLTSQSGASRFSSVCADGRLNGTTLLATSHLHQGTHERFFSRHPRDAFRQYVLSDAINYEAK